MVKINLHELTVDNVGQWPLPVKASILFGMSLFISMLGYWLIVSHHVAKYDRLKVQEITLKNEFENKQRQVVNLAEYRQQLAIMTERFAVMLKQLAAKNEIPGLLEEISKIGVASGLRFELFAPQPEIAHDFYVELPIKISVVGNYFQLAEFLSRVAEMTHIVTVHEFCVERESSKQHKVVSEDELVMKITAKIYRYLP
ncbi:MAG: type 4a pilus biogenesis protein PilO [Legionella sp.]|uniref:type 4a pilus biogenesis protein PilO n=1 Tax=Legionella sp. TaxID=459 RepID=UPI0039E46B91